MREAIYAYIRPSVLQDGQKVKLIYKNLREYEREFIWGQKRVVKGLPEELLGKKWKEPYLWIKIKICSNFWLYIGAKKIKFWFKLIPKNVENSLFQIHITRHFVGQGYQKLDLGDAKKIRESPHIFLKMIRVSFGGVLA